MRTSTVPITQETSRGRGQGKARPREAGRHVRQQCQQLEDSQRGLAVLLNL
jgi:hypothetical protein